MRRLVRCHPWSQGASTPCRPLTFRRCTVFDGILGFLDTIMQPIYAAMSGILVGFHWLYSHILHPDSGWTWALSIVSLTIVVRMLMIPLFVKQINSSRQMQLVAPKTRALQEKYGNDREKYGQEVMKLYQEEGVNPAASCLPLLIQMPIFLGLFYVLNGAAHGQPKGYFFEQAPHLASSLQHAQIFGAEISATLAVNGLTNFNSTFFVAVVLIIGMTATLFITQLQLLRKNMPPEALTGPMAQQQKMMLYIFPAIYLFTGVNFPIGVMIYWLASNLWTLGQQYILIHNNPTPGTPAFIDWEERTRAKGKDPDKIMAERRAKMRRKKGPAVAGDPTKVARQNTSSTTSKESTSTDQPGASAPTNESGKQRIQRQQPNKGSRANRKQARPGQ
ncbi:membrane protein insertase YidC [Propioniciclava coleopterorum]|uniref:Membrane protein insertase YidC n=2 Tax=Propioniciclava coleopterorum TaxID=2714937 RepID=A0A6G7YB55_9ACTN|nr:membrane protein insertase YidC [Propioniciclava coleopterorum]